MGDSDRLTWTVQGMRGGSIRCSGGWLAVALLAGVSGFAASGLDAAAKDPGRVHCYRDVCHRVRSIEETRRLIGRTLRMDASYYDDAAVDRFNRGTVTSNGETFDAGSPGRVSSSDLPDGTELLLRNPENGLTSHVRVNDFGPFYGSRLIDVTRRVARDLGFARKGVTPLEVTIISAPLPDEATFRRNRVAPPALGHIGVVEASELPTLVRRLVSIDRRLAIQARRSNLPEIAVSLSPLEPAGGDTLAALPAGQAASASAEPPAGRATPGYDDDTVEVAAIAQAPQAIERLIASDLAEETVAAFSVADPAPRTDRPQPAEPRVLASARPFASSRPDADPGPLTPAVFEAGFPRNNLMLVSLALAGLASLALYSLVLRSGGQATGRIGARASDGATFPRLVDGRVMLPAEPPSAGPGQPEVAETSSEPGAPSPAREALATCIGDDVTITGRVVSRGAIAIAGHVLGDVHAETVEILPGGRVLGHVEARRLVVAGTLRGTARAATVHATGTGALFADLEYGTLTAEPGSFIDGTLRSLGRRGVVPA